MVTLSLRPGSLLLEEIGSQATALLPDGHEWTPLHIFDWTCVCHGQSWNFLDLLVIDNNITEEVLNDLPSTLSAPVSDWIKINKPNREFIIDYWETKHAVTPKDY